MLTIFLARRVLASLDDQGNEFTSFRVNPEETHHAGKELKKVIRELSAEVAPEGSQAARIP
jgi:hypothetical protein